MKNRSTSLDERLKNRFSKKKAQEKEVNTSAEKGYFMISIHSVKPSTQVRQTFTIKEINKRKRSLLDFGQLDPIILIQDESNGNFFIEDGELTWRAASQIVEEDSKSSFLKLKAAMSDSHNSDEAYLRSLLHHQHSVSLNPLDNGESNLVILGKNLGIEREELIKLLRNISYLMRKHLLLKEAIDLYCAERIKSEVIEEYLNDSQIQLVEEMEKFQVDILTFINNDLPYTLYPQDLKDAIRKRGLSCAQAKVISKISSKKVELDPDELIKLREKVIKQALENKLSNSQLKPIVNSILKEFEAETQETSKKRSQETKKKFNIIKSEFEDFFVQDLNKQQLTSLRSVLAKRLKEVEEQLA